MGGIVVGAVPRGHGDRAVDVDAEYPVGGEAAEFDGDEVSGVAALRAVAVVAEAVHEGGDHAGEILGAALSDLGADAGEGESGE